MVVSMRKTCTDKNRKTVLVTGGAGYIGSVLTEVLVKRGFFVKVLDTFYFGRSPLKNLHNNIEIIEGDIRRPPVKAFNGVDAIIHLAGLSNDPTAEFNPTANKEINTIATKNLAITAKKHGVKRFIFASSCSIYDKGLENDIDIKDENFIVTPRYPYALSKYLAERELLKLHDTLFNVIIFRKGTVHGFSPRMRYDLIINTMIRFALQHKAIRIYCRGLQWRPIIAIEDVVEAYCIVLDADLKDIGGEIFNITGDNYQVKEIAERVKDMIEHCYNIPIRLVYEQDNKIDRSYRVSNDKAKEKLKFTPKISMNMSIKSILEQISHSQYYQDFDNPIFNNIEWMRPILKKMS